MAHKQTRPKRMTMTDRLLDEIKDEIDRLHDVKNLKLRREAARELIDYITLHHNLPSY